jgi:hypothetical protein
MIWAAYPMIEGRSQNSIDLRPEPGHCAAQNVSRPMSGMNMELHVVHPLTREYVQSTEGDHLAEFRLTSDRSLARTPTN